MGCCRFGPAPSPAIACNAPRSRWAPKRRGSCALRPCDAHCAAICGACFREGHTTRAKPFCVLRPPLGPGFSRHSKPACFGPEARPCAAVWTTQFDKSANIIQAPIPSILAEACSGTARMVDWATGESSVMGQPGLASRPLRKYTNVHISQVVSRSNFVANNELTITKNPPCLSGSPPALPMAPARNAGLPTTNRADRARTSGSDALPAKIEDCAGCNRHATFLFPAPALPYNAQGGRRCDNNAQ